MILTPSGISEMEPGSPTFCHITEGAGSPSAVHWMSRASVSAASSYEVGSISLMVGGTEGKGAMDLLKLQYCLEVAKKLATRPKHTWGGGGGGGVKGPETLFPCLPIHARILVTNQLSMVKFRSNSH